MCTPQPLAASVSSCVPSTPVPSLTSPPPPFRAPFVLNDIDTVSLRTKGRLDLRNELTRSVLSSVTDVVGIITVLHSSTDQPYNSSHIRVPAPCELYYDVARVTSSVIANASHVATVARHHGFQRQPHRERQQQQQKEHAAGCESRTRNAAGETTAVRADSSGADRVSLAATPAHTLNGTLDVAQRDHSVLKRTTCDVSTQCSVGNPSRHQNAMRCSTEAASRATERLTMQMEDYRSMVSIHVDRLSASRRSAREAALAADIERSDNAARVAELRSAKKVAEARSESLAQQLGRERKRYGDLESRLSSLHKAHARVLELEEKCALLTSRASAVLEAKAESQAMHDKVIENARNEVDLLTRACECKDEEIAKLKRGSKAACSLAHALRTRLASEEVRNRILRTSLLQLRTDLESAASYDSVFCALSILSEHGKACTRDHTAEAFAQVCATLQGMWLREFGPGDARPFVVALDALMCGSKCMPLSCSTRNVVCLSMSARDTLIAACGTNQSEHSRAGIAGSALYASSASEEMCAVSPIMRWTRECIEEPVLKGVGILNHVLRYMDDGIESVLGEVTSRDSHAGMLYGHVASKTIRRFDSPFCSLVTVSPCPESFFSCVAGAMMGAVSERSYDGTMRGGRIQAYQAHRLLCESNMLLFSTWAKIRPSTIASAIAERVMKSPLRAVIQPIGIVTPDVRALLRSADMTVDLAREKKDEAERTRLFSRMQKVAPHLRFYASEYEYLLGEMCIVYARDSSVNCDAVQSRRVVCRAEGDLIRLAVLRSLPGANPLSCMHDDDAARGVSKASASSDESEALFYVSNSTVSVQCVADGLARDAEDRLNKEKDGEAGALQEGEKSRRAANVRQIAGPLLDDTGTSRLTHAMEVDAHVSAMHTVTSAFVRPFALHVAVCEAAAQAAMSALAIRSAALETINRTLDSLQSTDGYGGGDAGQGGADGNCPPALTHTQNMLLTTCALLDGSCDVPDSTPVVDRPNPLRKMVLIWNRTTHVPEHKAQMTLLPSLPPLPPLPPYSLPLPTSPPSSPCFALTPEPSCPSVSGAGAGAAQEGETAAGGHTDSRQLPESEAARATGAGRERETTASSRMQACCVLLFLPREPLVESLSATALVHLASCKGTSGLDIRGNAARERAAAKLKQKRTREGASEGDVEKSASPPGGACVQRRHWNAEDLKEPQIISPSITAMFQQVGTQISISVSLFSIQNNWKGGPITKTEANSFIFVYRIDFPCTDIEVFARVAIHSSACSEPNLMYAFVLHVIKGVVRNMRTVANEISREPVDNIQVFDADPLKSSDMDQCRRVDLAYLIRRMCLALDSNVDQVHVQEYCAALRAKTGIDPSRVAVVHVNRCEW